MEFTKLGLTPIPNLVNSLALRKQGVRAIFGARLCALASSCFSTMKKQEGCTNYIPMAFLISIIVFLYGTFLGSYIPPLLMKASDAPSSILSGTFLQPYGHPLAYMIIMNILFFMMALSFSCAHFSDPGKVPYEWVRLSEEVEGVVLEEVVALCFLPQPPHPAQGNVNVQ